MRKSHLVNATSICLFCATAAGLLGATRRPGLWEYTTTMTWQQAPVAPGSDLARLGGGTQTTQVCLTEELIDQYGILLPHSRGQCSIENKQVEPGRITADYVCSGMMTGKGALLSEWSDSEHVTGKLHFTGIMKVGAQAEPVEWTRESKAVFKSPDCGSVKPEALPKGRS